MPRRRPARPWRRFAGIAAGRARRAGHADLSAHVDFAAIRRGGRARRRRVLRPGAAGPSFWPRSAPARGSPRCCAKRAARAPGESRSRSRPLDRSARDGHLVQGAGLGVAGAAGAGGFEDQAGRNRDDHAQTPLPPARRVRHGFFTREGGVSGGIFASLNCGFGSRDDPANVAAQPRPRDGAARTRRGGAGRPATRSTAPPCSRSSAAGRRCRAARRRHGHRPAGHRARRPRGGLRADPLRRRAGRDRRRRAWRLARRAGRHRRGHRRGDGGARRPAVADSRRHRPLHRPAFL